MGRNFGIELETNVFASLGLLHLELRPKGYWLDFKDPQYSSENQILCEGKICGADYSLVYVPSENSFEMIFSPSQDISFLEGMVKEGYETISRNADSLEYHGTFFPGKSKLGLYDFDLSLEVSPGEMGYHSIEDIPNIRSEKDFYFLYPMFRGKNKISDRLLGNMISYVKQNDYELTASLRLINDRLVLHLSVAPSEVHMYHEINTGRIAGICEGLYNLLEENSSSLRPG